LKFRSSFPLVVSRKACKQALLWLLLLAGSWLMDEVGYPWLSYVLLCLTFAAMLTSVNNANLFQTMWAIATVLFGFLPPFILLYAGESGDLWLLRFLVLTTIGVFLSTAGYRYTGASAGGVKCSAKAVCSLTCAAIAALLVSAGGTFLYLTPALILASSFSLGHATRRAAVLIICLYLVHFFCYILIFWNGFGRLMIAAMIIPFYFVVAHERNWAFNRYLVIGAALFGGLAASIGRIRGESVVESLTEDSVFSPYITAVQISNSTAARLDFLGWLDQFLTYIYGAFPRVLWESKPLGFGRQYVVDELATSSFSEGHSIAALFLGENLHYLGAWWPAGVAASLSALVAIFIYLHSRDRGSGSLGVLVCLWVPTYFWGGVASFSTRFQFGLLASLTLYLVLRLAKRRPGTSHMRIHRSSLKDKHVLHEE